MPLQTILFLKNIYTYTALHYLGHLLACCFFFFFTTWPWGKNTTLQLISHGLAGHKQKETQSTKSWQYCPMPLPLWNSVIRSWTCCSVIFGWIWIYHVCKPDPMTTRRSIQLLTSKLVPLLLPSQNKRHPLASEFVHGKYRKVPKLTWPGHFLCNGYKDASIQWAIVTPNFNEISPPALASDFAFSNHNPFCDCQHACAEQCAAR